MILHRLNGHFFPVKDTCSQGSLHVSLFKDLWEVFKLIKMVSPELFLQKIKGSIENALNNELKIERDRRMEFKPHLTIGRLKKQRIDYKTFDSFKNLMAENKNLEFGSFKISQIKLKKSELTPRGPIYSDLEFW